MRNALLYLLQHRWIPTALFWIKEAKCKIAIIYDSIYITFLNYKILEETQISNCHGLQIIRDFTEEVHTGVLGVLGAFQFLSCFVGYKSVYVYKSLQWLDIQNCEFCFYETYANKPDLRKKKRTYSSISY